MTPSSWLTILAFFLFVAPGLLFDLLSARKRAKHRESTFTEISRVALISTVCSVATFGLLAVVAGVCAWRDWKLLPDPSAMIKQGNNYVADNFVTVLASCAAFVVLSLLTSWLWFIWTYRGHKGGVSYTSAWRLVMRDHSPEHASVHVRAMLSDGTVWFGRVADYSPDLEAADRDLVLRPPLAQKSKPDGTSSSGLKCIPAKWAYVVLRGSEIVSLAVSYGPQGPDVTPSTNGPPDGASSPGTGNRRPAGAPRN